ncbi:MAG: hypothetical protein AAF682_04925 [Planctomycetota bacterium]
MRSKRSPWSWLVLVVWCAWIYALLGRLAAEPAVRGWVPDLGLVLLLGLEPRLSRRDAVRAALVIGLARAAFSADAPTAILAGTLGAVSVSRGLRNVVESDAALPRAAVTGICALLLGLFLAAVHRARLSAGFGAVDFALPLGTVVRGAAATALASLLVWPLLVRLPGLTPLVASRGSRFA